LLASYSLRKILAEVGEDTLLLKKLDVDEI
jgi:hypothetical protein